MKHNTWRTYAPALVGMLVSLLVASLLLYGPMEQRRILTQGLEKRARVLLSLFAESAKVAIDFGSTAPFLDAAEQLAGGEHALKLARIVSGDGAAFASYGEAVPSSSLILPQDKEVVVASVSGTLVVAQRLNEAGAAVFVGLSDAEVTEAYQRQLYRAFIAAAVVLLVGALVSLFLARLARQSVRDRWLKSGQAALSELLRGDFDMAGLSKDVVTFLAKYLGAQVGALYVGDGQTFSLTGSYAFTQRKRLSNTFALGEGLVGQAALEKEPIVISEVPDDYIAVSSGLGLASPRSITVVPFIYNDEVKAVIELGGLRPFAKHQLELLRTAGEGAAIAISSAQARLKLQQLLDTTQQQAADLRAKQEELHVSNQELEIQARNLRESRESLRQQSEQLQSANQGLEEKTLYLEQQKHAIAEQNKALETARAELENRASDLEQASKYKSEFLANMSHELRTPLNSLLILARDLAENKTGNLTADQVESGVIIEKSGKDLLHLINDILDLSKVEAGKMSIVVEPIEIATVLRDLENLFTPLAGERGITFATSVTPGVAKAIRTDGQRLQQILKNLLSNAMKFTPKGSVTLRVSSAPADREGRPMLAFAVVDTGIGIPEDRQRAIFEAFQQADGSTSRNYGGTGLGLTISRKLAGLLGGSIDVRSRVGEGSTFTAYLPAEHSPSFASPAVAEAPTAPVVLFVPPQKVVQAAPPAATAAPAPARPAPRASFVSDDRANVRPGDRCVLVVEDDPIFAHVLVQVAHKSGYKCVAAADGASALVLAQELRPLGIILDLGLPDISGVEVLEQLKFNAATRHIPVHVISGAEDPGPLLSKGALGLIKKPASADEITQALAKAATMSAESTKNVLLIAPEHHAQSLRRWIENATTVVTTAHGGADAAALCREQTFQCVVLDSALGDAAAVDALETLTNACPAESLPPIIVYGSTNDHASLRDKLAALRDSAVKCVDSEERVIDEVALFLHSVEAALSPEQRQAVRVLHDPDRALNGRHVLLVDDDMRNLFAISKVLQERGLKVIKAENGQVALDKLAQCPEIEMVLMDIMMPVMDGYEAMRRIRADQRTAALPIVALTAKTGADERAKCMSAGANDFITKPVDVDKLLAVLRIWLFKAA